MFVSCVHLEKVAYWHIEQLITVWMQWRYLYCTWGISGICMCTRGGFHWHYMLLGSHNLLLQISTNVALKNNYYTSTTTSNKWVVIMKPIDKIKRTGSFLLSVSFCLFIVTSDVHWKQNSQGSKERHLQCEKHWTLKLDFDKSFWLIIL